MVVMTSVGTDLGSVVATAVGLSLSLSLSNDLVCFSFRSMTSCSWISRVVHAFLLSLSSTGFLAMLEFGNEKWLPFLVAIMHPCVRTVRVLRALTTNDESVLKRNPTRHTMKC